MTRCDAGTPGDWRTIFDLVVDAFINGWWLPTIDWRQEEDDDE